MQALSGTSFGYLLTRGLTIRMRGLFAVTGAHSVVVHVSSTLVFDLKS